MLGNTFRPNETIILARPHIVYGARLVMVAVVCRRRLPASVTLHGGPAGGFTRA